MVWVFVWRSRKPGLLSKASPEYPGDLESCQTGPFLFVREIERMNEIGQWIATFCRDTLTGQEDLTHWTKEAHRGSLRFYNLSNSKEELPVRSLLQFRIGDEVFTQPYTSLSPSSSTPSSQSPPEIPVLFVHSVITRRGLPFTPCIGPGSPVLHIPRLTQFMWHKPLNGKKPRCHLSTWLGW